MEVVQVAVLEPTGRRIVYRLSKTRKVFPTDDIAKSDLVIFPR
jgi:hypothetical protein